MERSLIKIKGGKNGFKLVVDSSADLAEAQKELEKKLAEHPEFFPAGTEFQLEVADLNRSVRSGLTDFLSQKGLQVTKEQPRITRSARTVVQPAPTAGPTAEEQMMKVINRTVRNGEEITSQGSVMVCGNVNPGAKIVAVGSVDVRGTCRGIIHAGIMGDMNAFVVADRLMPMQIRIANLIARSPDDPEQSSYAEKAYIKDGQIVIEPIER